MQLSGWLGLPTAARSTSDGQFCLVNGRGVRDRLLGNRRSLRLPRRAVYTPGTRPTCATCLDPRLSMSTRPPSWSCAQGQPRVHDYVFRAVERALAASAAGDSASGCKWRHATVTHGASTSMRRRVPPAWSRSVFGVAEALRVMEPAPHANLAAFGRGASARHRHRATPWSVRAGPESCRNGAGRHARGARAGPVRELQVAARGRRAGRRTPAGADGPHAAEHEIDALLAAPETSPA